MSAAYQQDQTEVILDNVADALDDAATDTKVAAHRLRRLKEQHEGGGRWREILTERSARQLLDTVTGASARLAQATGLLRRAIGQALRRDGLRVRQIADLLGVSHQRVSEILNSNGREKPGTL